MKERVEKVVIIGAGYVGLPTAVLLARAGISVHAVDVKRELVDAINDGTLRVEEDSINRLLEDPEVRGKLSAGADPEPADAFFICVPTPIDYRRKIANLSNLKAACRTILPCLEPGNLVIIESTVPVLCTRETVKPILESGGLEVGRDLFLAYCPERVLPGNAIEEITENARVIGGVDERSTQKAAGLYRRFVNGSLHLASDVEAEICKLAENAFRDVNIAFASELAALCESIGVDPMRVVRLANYHPRVNILSPGIGVGGHCIPVDPWFIAEVDRVNSTLIQCARLINDLRPHRIAARIREAVGGLSKPRIVAHGLAFKPNCRDLRASPAGQIVDLLRSEGYDVTAVDPLIEAGAYPGLVEMARDADLIAVLVEHDVTLQEIAGREKEILAAMRTPKILRFYPPVEVRSAPGFAAVASVGRVGAEFVAEAPDVKEHSKKEAGA
ncbi:MAG: nucleotide sugar dehydrogenase [Armatimonadetes bacterium]|nr:nucleotide sugar dehydrogenase [Armatimonadota bacterium]